MSSEHPIANTTDNKKKRRVRKKPYNTAEHINAAMYGLSVHNYLQTNKQQMKIGKETAWIAAQTKMPDLCFTRFVDIVKDAVRIYLKNPADPRIAAHVDLLRVSAHRQLALFGEMEMVTVRPQKEEKPKEPTSVGTMEIERVETIITIPARLAVPRFDKRPRSPVSSIDDETEQRKSSKTDYLLRISQRSGLDKDRIMIWSGALGRELAVLDKELDACNQNKGYIASIILNMFDPNNFRAQK